MFLQGAAGDLSVQTSPADSLKDDDPARVPRDGAPGLQASLAAVKAAKNLDEAAASELAREFIQSDFRMEAFGRGLGKEAVAIAMTIQTSVPAQPLIHGSYERLAFASRIDFRNPQVVAAYAAAFFPELAQAYASDHRDNVIRPALTTVVINSQLALVGGSGEFFCSHANHLKEQSPGVKTLFFGYCNGHHMYFPTVEAAAEGGYGADAFVAWTEIGGGEQIVSRAVVNIHRMLGEPKSAREAVTRMLAAQMLVVVCVGWAIPSWLGTRSGGAADDMHKLPWAVPARCRVAPGHGWQWRNGIVPTYP